MSNCGQVLTAARWSKVNRHQHYVWMEEDPTYPARFKQAKRRWLQALEDEANRRAHDGVESPVLYEGKPVYVVGGPLKEREYSDTLLLALLKAYDRERFGDKSQVDLNWSGRLEDLSEGATGSIDRAVRGIGRSPAEAEAARGWSGAGGRADGGREMPPMLKRFAAALRSVTGGT